MKAGSKKKNILPQERIDELFNILKKRFEKHMDRHPGIKWEEYQSRLEKKPDKLWSVNEMEETGGEPDVIVVGKNTKELVVCDCSPETPKGRRSLCYDHEALESRKEHKPKDSATGMAAEMGIELLTEQEYFDLQALGDFDNKTSSWLLTPAEQRGQGGAIFGDRRFGRVFVYHNGAESYYAARGFRGKLEI